MTTTRCASLAAAVTLGLAALGIAQTPRGAAVANLAGKKISIDYGRPSLKGRDLAELLKQLPADRIWRAGENQVTTFATEGPIAIGGQKVPAGKYSVYVHAGERGDWALVLNRDLGVPLGKIWDKAPDNLKNEPWPHLEGYAKAIGDQEVARVKMKAAAASDPVDLFTISLTPKGGSAELMLAWGKEAWSVGVEPAK